jgi:PX domain
MLPPLTAVLTRVLQVTYLITVNTNLVAYEVVDGDGEAGEAATSPTMATEREISLRRSYSHFVKLRADLVRKKVAGAASLPVLPGKPMFGGSVSEKETEKRCAAFDAFFKALAKSPELASCEIVVGFLSEVPLPVWEEVHAQTKSKMNALLSLTTGWDVQYSKNGIEIAVMKVPDSDFVLIKSDLTLPLPSSTVHKMYTVRL